MQLTFAGGEHAPFVLPEGLIEIGATSAAAVVLAQPGIAFTHARIERHGERVQLRPCAQPVRLNGRPLRDAILLKPGDTVEFASVRCRVNREQVAGDVRQHTRLRTAVPRFVLRGVSGPTFGRNFGIDGELMLGRQPDCDISIPVGEISRRHVRLRLAPDGVLVEDLNSANGTCINGERVRNGLLKPGDELALDTVRFMLLAPTVEVVARKSPQYTAAKSRRVLRIAAWSVAAITLVLLAAKAFAAAGF